MQRIASLRRFLFISALGTGMALLMASWLPAEARACGPYGELTPEDRAINAAIGALAEREPERFVVALRSIAIEDDRAAVRLVVQDEAGHRFDRAVRMVWADGVWSVTRVGKARPTRRTA